MRARNRCMAGAGSSTQNDRVVTVIATARQRHLHGMRERHVDVDLTGHSDREVPRILNIERDGPGPFSKLLARCHSVTPVVSGCGSTPASGVVLKADRSAPGVAEWSGHDPWIRRRRLVPLDAGRRTARRRSAVDPGTFDLGPAETAPFGNEPPNASRGDGSPLRVAGTFIVLGRLARRDRGHVRPGRGFAVRPGSRWSTQVASTPHEFSPGWLAGNDRDHVDLELGHLRRLRQ